MRKTAVVLAITLAGCNLQEKLEGPRADPFYMGTYSGPMLMSRNVSGNATGTGRIIVTQTQDSNWASFGDLSFVRDDGMGAFVYSTCPVTIMAPAFSGGCNQLWSGTTCGLVRVEVIGQFNGAANAMELNVSLTPTPTGSGAGCERIAFRGNLTREKP